MATTPAPDDDVEKILTGIMSKQSPLMKQARTQGTQAAQTAGLGQSTMGIKAAQAAAYNAAMPIASQQSQQIHQKGMQTSQFGHETGMQQAGFGQETAMQGREFGQQTAMQGREFGQQSKMQGAQFGHETGMQTAGFAQAASQAEKDRVFQSNLQSSAAYWDRMRDSQAATQERATLGMQQYQETTQNALNRSSQERIASMEISAQDKERALSAVTQFNNSYSSAYAQIAANENIPADARNGMLTQLAQLRDHNQNLTTSLYRNTVPW